MAVRVVPTTGFNLGSLGSLSGWGSAMQGVGSLYGAYNQNKMSNKLYSLQKDYLKKEDDRKKRSQARLDYAGANYLGHKDDNAKLPINY